MGWLKRNLFFAIGGILSLGLLAAAGYYDYAGWQHNQAAFVKLNETYNKLTELSKKKPSPGNGKVPNIAAAKNRQTSSTSGRASPKIISSPCRASPPPARCPTNRFQHALHRDHQTIAGLRRRRERATPAAI